MPPKGTPQPRWRLVRAQRDAVPASVRRFNQRAQQRRLHAVSPFLAAGIGIALLGIAAWGVYGTSLLGVRQVRVEGNQLVSADQVRAAAAVPAGAPLASLDLGAVARRVGQLAPVRQARATRDWPSTVVIQVTERAGVAAVPRPGGSFAVLDGTGVLFRTLPAPGELAVLRLTTPGPQDETTRAALQVLAALTAQLRARLVALDAPAPTRIRLELSGGRTVIWGDATANAAKARVATSLLARPGTVIDVSAPDVVTVH
ncbi:MAG: FtsQ-type POTRA domain-containing protein [Micromonosporaceae bacterium]|nr:FtsQ-type POTRA domain-containing protein [Micromonosporaceae bacterium]